MNELADLERRIKEALDRIDGGLDKAAPVAAEKTDAPDAASPDLQEALEAEKVANAQLEERIKALRHSKDEQAKTMQARIDAITADLEDRQAKLRQLRQASEQMRTALEKLREANAQGVSEPHLINQAMQSELQGLRQTRDADRDELNAILASLEPLLEDRADA